MTAPTKTPGPIVQGNLSRGDGLFAPLRRPFGPPIPANPKSRVLIQILPISQNIVSTADPGTYAVTGNAANDAIGSQAGIGAYTYTGVATTDVRDVPATAGIGAYTVSGTVANDGIGSQAAIGVYLAGGVAANDSLGSVAGLGQYTVTGVDTTDVISASQNVVSIAEPGSYGWSGIDSVDVVASGAPVIIDNQGTMAGYAYQRWPEHRIAISYWDDPDEILVLTHAMLEEDES